MKTSERANMHNRTGLTSSLSTCSAHPRGTMSQRKACSDSRMLSSSVASPCQTLRQLAYRPRVNAYSWPNPSISGTAHAQCAERLNFSAFESTHTLKQLASLCCGLCVVADRRKHMYQPSTITVAAHAR